MLCPVCLKIMNNPELEFMLGIERPYMNIYLHLECKKTINLHDFISQNAELLYNIHSEQLKSKERRK